MHLKQGTKILIEGPPIGIHEMTPFDEQKASTNLVQTEQKIGRPQTSRE